MLGWLRHLLRHRHRPVCWASVMVSSVATGVPVTVMSGSICRCGEILSEQYTDAGYQQLIRGADQRPWIDELHAKLHKELRKLVDPRALIGLG